MKNLSLTIGFIFLFTFCNKNIESIEITPIKEDILQPNVPFEPQVNISIEGNEVSFDSLISLKYDDGDLMGCLKFDKNWYCDILAVAKHDGLIHINLFNQESSWYGMLQNNEYEIDTIKNLVNIKSIGRISKFGSDNSQTTFIKLNIHQIKYKHHDIFICIKIVIF